MPLPQHPSVSADSYPPLMHVPGEQRAPNTPGCSLQLQHCPCPQVMRGQEGRASCICTASCSIIRALQGPCQTDFRQLLQRDAMFVPRQEQPQKKVCVPSPSADTAHRSVEQR